MGPRERGERTDPRRPRSSCFRTAPEQPRFPIMTVEVALLGFPRIGAHRELKLALERHWSGEFPESDLIAEAKALRRRTWALESARGATVQPINDFSLYDHVLDTSAMLGALPVRFGDRKSTRLNSSHVAISY